MLTLATTNDEPMSLCRKFRAVVTIDGRGDVPAELFTFYMAATLRHVAKAYAQKNGVTTDRLRIICRDAD